jgi:hypothetical protein
MEELLQMAETMQIKPTPSEMAKTPEEYYKAYEGPPLRFAYVVNEQALPPILAGLPHMIDTIDETMKENVTNMVNTIYGENHNWNGQVCTAGSLKNSNYIGKALYLEYEKTSVNFPGHKTYTAVLLENENTVINPPLFTPFSVKE